VYRTGANKKRAKSGFLDAGTYRVPVDWPEIGAFRGSFGLSPESYAPSAREPTGEEY